VQFSRKALIPGEKKDFEFLSRAGMLSSGFWGCRVLPNEVVVGFDFSN
jgi:hypothetical protein